MDLTPNDDQVQIVDAARSVLEKELAVDPARWRDGPAAAKDRAMLGMFAELGWLGLGLSEDKGGAGFGAAEEMLLFREAGRFLVTPRLLASIAAARLADTQTAAAVVAGTARVGLALPRDASAAYLVEADDADLVVLVGHDRIALFAAEAFEARESLRCIDETVAFEKASLRGAPLAELTGDDARGALDHFSLLVAAMLVGMGEAVRDLTVAHASERAQFGQKIGTFQAVSHPLADMAVRCEGAASQAMFAAVTYRDGAADAPFHVAAARIVAVGTAIANATASIQLHGGMGFAAEYPVHFFLKRAHLLDRIGGGLGDQLDRFMDLDAQ